MKIAQYCTASSHQVLRLPAMSAVLVILLTLSAHADIYIPPTGNSQSTIYYSQPIGESFTADATSYSAMGLWIKDVNQFAAPADFTIQYALYAGAGTSGTLLDTQIVTAPYSSFAGFLDADFSSVALIVGNVYSLVATQDTERWAIVSGPDDYYAGGSLIVQGEPWINPHLEASFHATPEPSTLVLAAVGLFALLAMAKRRRTIGAAAVLSALLLLPTGAEGALINTMPVGNPGNAADVQPQGSFGAVAYNYRIGTFEVNNDQYVQFLNAKAASDPLGLYNPNMGSDPRGGITQSGISGSYTYAAKTNMGIKPVNYVSWYDAIRFVNWLQNGQGNGDTETGAYTLLGGTPTPTNGLSITRNPGSTWVLPSEDEWYKAAYYDPTLNGGSGDYWDFPTQSNVAPILAAASPNGNILNMGPNVANYDLSADWNGQDGNVTSGGAAMSESFYRTVDQGGNVWEWNEALIDGQYRSLRGGSWPNGSNTLMSSFRNDPSPTVEVNTVGFRVANVPEPSALALSGIGMLAFIGLRMRQKTSHRAACRPIGVRRGSRIRQAEATTFDTKERSSTVHKFEYALVRRNRCASAARFVNCRKSGVRSGIGYRCNRQLQRLAHAQ